MQAWEQQLERASTRTRFSGGTRILHRMAGCFAPRQGILLLCPDKSPWERHVLRPGKSLGGFRAVHVVSMTSPPDGPSRAAGAAAALAMPGLVLWAMVLFTAVMGWSVAGSALRDLLLPLGMRLCLLAGEVAALALAVGASAAAVRLADRAASGRPPRLRTAVEVGARALVGGVLVFGTAASWTLFWATGRFADGRSVEFLLTNGWMVLGYARRMNPGLLVGVPLAALAVVGLAAAFGRRLRDAFPEAAARRLLAPTAALAAASLAGLAAGQILHRRMDGIVIDEESGTRCSASQWYEYRRDQSAGPFSHRAARLFSGEDRAAPPAGAAELQRRPRVSGEQYRKAVDAAAVRRWSVVLVVIDSLRPDQLKAFGGAREVMPRLDALARESRIFTDVRSESSHTDYAMLSPVSSQYPLREAKVHRYPRNPPYPRDPVYDLLKPLGYRTAYITSQDGRWGQMMNYLDTGGLDHVVHAGGAGGDWTSDHVVDDAVTVDEAIRWISKSPEPFFLDLILENSHFPYLVPDGWPRRFGRPADFPMSFGRFPRDRARDVQNLYADALAYTDRQVARLIDHLQAQGRWDRTLLIVTADHGEAFYEHDVSMHASKIYDEVMKVPLLLRAPGLAPGADGRPAQLIDIPPTILDLLKLPPHPGYQGLSLVADPAPTTRSRFMVAQSPLATQYGIERGGWKLIEDAEARLYRLFDLRRDPGEKDDRTLAEPGVFQDLRWRLSAWKDAQLDYYRSPDRMKNESPPVISERR